MDVILLFRFLLPIIAIIGFFLTTKWVNPPTNVFKLVLKICWIAGILNLFVDLFQQHSGFWHYSINGLALGLFPIDLYISVSLVVGGIVPLIYWKIRAINNKWIIPFILSTHFYLLFQDYLVTKVAENKVLVIDSPYWWLADFFSLAVILYGTLVVFDYFLARKV